MEPGKGISIRWVVQCVTVVLGCQMCFYCQELCWRLCLHQACGGARHYGASRARPGQLHSVRSNLASCAYLALTLFPSSVRQTVAALRVRQGRQDVLFFLLRCSTQLSMQHARRLGCLLAAVCVLVFKWFILRLAAR
jgi:hypothetical protein